MRKRIEKPICGVCGDQGVVAKAFLDPSLSLPRALDPAPCPKCSKGDGKEIARPWAFLFEPHE